ncbi:MAG: hypothetical protein JWP41_4513, partial [Ramlibacter sp.]|nr:hypothetical protein [Ramlibacter sp.]
MKSQAPDPRRRSLLAATATGLAAAGLGRAAQAQAPAAPT